MPKVSVIIPVYNVEKYLRQCLDSVVNQTLKDIEIICVDDGSTDNSLKILKEYASKDDRFIIIEQKNKGAGAARNKGLEIANGEYLYFLDSDDFVDLSALEKLNTQIKKCDADICVCKNYDFIENENSLKEPFWIPDLKYIDGLEIFNKYDISEYLFNFCTIPAYTKLYKRVFIAQNNIKFQEIKSCNDVFFNFYSLACAEKITFIDEYLVTYRQGQSGSITSKRGRHITCILKAFKKLKKYLKKRGYYKLLKASMYKRERCCFDYEISKCTYKNKNYWKNELYKFLPKEYRTGEKYTLLQSIFSVRNFGTHKVICIFGLKFKFKSKKLINRAKYENLEKRLNALINEVNTIKNSVEVK